MTPDEFRAVRERLKLSAEAFAGLIGAGSGRTVRRWEAGDRPIPGPVQVIITALRDSAAVRRHFRVKV